MFWRPSERFVAITSWRDDFDTSLESYPINQVTASIPPIPGEDLVPPNLHHILLGRPRSSAPENWNTSMDSCIKLHPKEAGWRHFFWDDEKAESFMADNYLWFLPTFLSYPHLIQRADSLRYFILFHYGGIFMDLDLMCKRALGPLRRFPSVTINASPAGVSNGFIMAEARHPFFAQLIENLAIYDLNWFGSSYASIMFSTGPMFLSAEHLRHSPRLQRRDDLRVLTSPLHALNGAVSTPLFNHLGSSSWHGGDVALLHRLLSWVRGPIGWLIFLSFVGVGLCAALAPRWLLSAVKRNQKPRTVRKWARVDHCDEDDLESVLAVPSPGLYVLVELAN